MDKSQVLEKATKYAALVSEKMNLKKVVLYGSYAKGDWKEESDIDLAVIVNCVEGDFLENEAILYKLRRDIDDRIEPVLLEENDNESGFLHEVLKHGEIIYSA